MNHQIFLFIWHLRHIYLCDMELTLKEWDGLTITAKLRDNATCEELIIAALDVISRVYGQETAINAYENVDPDGMCVRN